MNYMSRVLYNSTKKMIVLSFFVVDGLLLVSVLLLSCFLVKSPQTDGIDRKHAIALWTAVTGIMLSWTMAHAYPLSYFIHRKIVVQDIVVPLDVFLVLFLLSLFVTTYLMQVSRFDAHKISTSAVANLITDKGYIVRLCFAAIGCAVVSVGVVFLRVHFVYGITVYIGILAFLMLSIWRSHNKGSGVGFCMENESRWMAVIGFCLLLVVGLLDLEDNYIYDTIIRVACVLLSILSKCVSGLWPLLSDRKMQISPIRKRSSTQVNVFNLIEDEEGFWDFETKEDSNISEII